MPLHRLGLGPTPAVAPTPAVGPTPIRARRWLPSAQGLVGSQIWQEELLSAVDINQDGGINVVEFVASTMEPRVFCEPTLFKAAFRILDADTAAVSSCPCARGRNYLAA